MAPLAIAKDEEFFEKEGLFITLEEMLNWTSVLDAIIDGKLDGSQMLAGQPIATSVGFGKQVKLATLITMGLNGNAISIGNHVWSEIKPNIPKDDNGKLVKPISAVSLKAVLKKIEELGKPFKMGVDFLVSGSNYDLRYWLASAEIHPGMYTKENVQGQINAKALLSVGSPKVLPVTVDAGTLLHRWGQITESKSANWYHKTIKNIYRPDIWENAANLLVNEGYLKASELPITNGYKSITNDFIDEKTNNPNDFVGYINSFSIGNKEIISNKKSKLF